MKPSIRIPIFVLFTFLTIVTGLLVQGCGEDAQETPPLLPNAIEITITPDTLSAPWLLSGPGGYANSGTGGYTISELAVGTYTIEWGELTGWQRPDPHQVSQDLALEETISFDGIYQEILDNGTITIDPDPDSLAAPWLLTGPGGYSLEGSGDYSATGFFAGEYDLTWGTLTGWNAPPDSTQILANGGTLNFPGTYEQYPPFANTPDQMMANFKMIYEGMLVGEYENQMHEGFRSIILQSTFDEWAGGDNPLTQLYFNKTLENTIHGNLFGYETGVGPGGELIPPVASINVATLDKDGTWDPVEATQEYFGDFEGAYKARYNVLIHFNNPDQHRYEVDQTIEFYAIAVEGEWFMLGQVGFDNYAGGMLATDSVTLDGVKSLYR